MFWRKSFKVSKHVKLNFTKNGVSSVSFGGKHARLGVNKKGLYTSANKDGFYVNQQLTGKTISKGNGMAINEASKKKHGIISKFFSVIGNIMLIGLNKINKNNKMEQNHTQEEIQGFYKEHYIDHIKYIVAGIVLLFIGFVFVPAILASILLLIIGIAKMIKNWKRINQEWKKRISK